MDDFQAWLDQESSKLGLLRDESAGAYGSWSNDPEQSWLDYLAMKGSDIATGTGNALSNISGAISPVGFNGENGLLLSDTGAPSPLGAALASSSDRAPTNASAVNQPPMRPYDFEDLPGWLRF